MFDTATHWTIFGQIIILLLIQIGGMGVVTIAVSLALPPVKNRAVQPRNNENLISAPNFSERNRWLTGFIIKGIFLIEIIGALIMLPVFWGDYGAEGIWMAVFHSVSAFCNAGFDIMGNQKRRIYFSDSLLRTTGYQYYDYAVNHCRWYRFPCMGRHLQKHKWRIREYRTQEQTCFDCYGCADCFTCCLFLLF